MNKFLKTFLEEFKLNYETSLNLDDAILKPMKYSTWKNDILKRSSGLREIYGNNNKIISKLNEFLKNDLDDDTANDLYEVLSDLYQNEFDDFLILGNICKKLIAYFELKNDKERLPYLYNVYAFESFEFYCRLGNSEYYAPEVTKRYKKVLEFENDYPNIKEYQNRRAIILSYSNLIAPMSQYDSELRKDIFDVYHNCKNLFDNVVIRVEGEEKAREDFLNLIDADILFMEEKINEMDEGQIEEFREIVNKLSLNHEFEDEEGNLKRAKLTLAIKDGKISLNDAIESLIETIKDGKKPDYDNEDEYTNLLYLLNDFNSAESIFDIFENFNVDSEKQTAYISRFVDIVTKEITRIPYTFMTQTCNHICSEWYKNVSKYLNGFEEKKELLFKCILSRQPVTYIHSLMVSEISKMIAENLLDKKPEIFQEAFDFDPKENKEKVLSYIETAALLHDIGKCQIAEIINKQSRSLSDKEFIFIKQHPERALDTLNNDKDFEPYFDIMLGHHKTYDDRFGYPLSFKKNESRYRFIIDLITISDCTDAATDIYGRNYNEGKNLQNLYKELVEGKGTKYNPLIVDSIGENKELFDKLCSITKDGRSRIYFDAYQKILTIK